jgi:hypothetical protein
MAIRSIDEIIAIDPGKTSGFAHFEVDFYAEEHPFTPVAMREIEWDEHWSFFLNLQHALENCAPEHTIVVVENFRLYAHEASHQINSDFPSSQIIGVCKYITITTGIELVLQMASVKRQFPSGELRKWFSPQTRLPTSLHIRDAISHALYLYFDRRLK